MWQVVQLSFHRKRLMYRKPDCVSAAFTLLFLTLFTVQFCCTVGMGLQDTMRGCCTLRSEG
jgi:hypothetical protein